MKIKILKKHDMSMSGHYVLRSIQNQSLPAVDLLVRECIQNSLDANIESKIGESVIVNFSTGHCEAKNVNKLFTGLTKTLNQRYKNEVEYIAIRDSKTCGLTGPLRQQDIKDANKCGNLRKLIYELGKNQDGEGKGGSWGIGKSVYFRIGIGIVLFYSRIKQDDGTFESRLAALLVEDEGAETSLLNESKMYNNGVATGIAWWGNIDKNDDSSYPITNEAEIEDIIDVFGINKYSGKETGTCVIIPYINRKKLENDANPSTNIHYNDLERFIKLSVQRWYFPRLYNVKYPFGTYLDFKMNGRKIAENERQKYFVIMEELYNAAITKVKKYPNIIPDYIQTKEISINKSFLENGIAGVVAFCHVTEGDLDMLPPHNQDIPYALIFKDEEDDETGNICILAYCRNAGMVINYEVQSGWTQGIPKQPEGEFILAFFHPNGENHLRIDNDMTFDEYLRKTERSDHSAWEDCSINEKKQDVLARIMKQVPKKIREAFADENAIQEAETDTVLGGILGKMFMPSSGYGRKRPTAADKTTKDSLDTVVKTITTTLRMKKIKFNRGNMSVQFSLKACKGLKSVKLYLKAHTNSGEIMADDWEKNLEEKFPFEIDVNDSMMFGPDGSDIVFTGIYTSSHNKCYGVEITLNESQENNVTGNILFSCEDNSISASIHADGE